MKISRYILAVMLNLGLLAFAIMPSFADGKPEQVTSKISLNAVNAAPNPPLLIAPENHIILADSTIEFIWDEVNGAINYEIEISKDWTFAIILHTNTISTPNYTYPVPNPNVADGYYWRVRAILPSEQTGWSEEWAFTYSLFDAPILISPVEGIAQTDSTMTFTWEPVPGAERYLIDIAIAPDGNSGVYGDVAYTNAYTQYFLQPNVYYWRVVAIGPNIPGQWNGGVYSEYRQFTIALSTAYDAPEFAFYNTFPNYATADMSVVMVDIIPQGIVLTIQFADNSMATVLMVLQVGNRLMNIQLQNLTWLSGGSPEKVMLIYEQIPLMFFQTLLEILPTDYLWVDASVLTHYHLVIDYAFMP